MSIMQAIDEQWANFCLQAIGRLKTVEDKYGIITVLADLEPAETGKIHGPDDDPEEVEYRKYKRFQDRYEREKLLESNARVCKLYSEALSSMQLYAGTDPFTEEPSKRWEHLCYGGQQRGKTWIWPWYKDCPNCGGRNPALGIWSKRKGWWEAGDRNRGWRHTCTDGRGDWILTAHTKSCGTCGVERP